MVATHALAETAHDAVTLAFADADSTISVRLPLRVAARLATELDRMVREASGVRVALSR